MGAEASTLKTGGTLLGETPLKKFKVVVPADKRGGQRMTISIKGKHVTIDIPMDKRPGESFIFKSGVSSKHVITSTLPTVPGMMVVEAKPIIWGSVSCSFGAMGRMQQTMGLKVGTLMQDAQSEIIKQAVHAECNAVLGMTYNVTNDSSGERGNCKLVIVTVCGTPCVVMPEGEQPTVVEANVIVEPI